MRRQPKKADLLAVTPTPLANQQVKPQTQPFCRWQRMIQRFRLRARCFTAVGGKFRAAGLYFRKKIPELPADHPALTKVDTINHTICADQISQSTVMYIYEWAPFIVFLSATMGKDALYPMRDALARVNVMAYRDGETLNWHFDRSEFTTTLLLQAPEQGGDFVYRTDLRTEANPNYDGVAKLLRGEDKEVQTIKLSAGTLNIFRGKNTAHKVSTVRGNRERLVAVFSYFDKPGVVFTREDQMGFYGRSV